MLTGELRRQIRRLMALFLHSSSRLAEKKQVIDFPEHFCLRVFFFPPVETHLPADLE